MLGGKSPTERRLESAQNTVFMLDLQARLTNSHEACTPGVRPLVVQWES